MHFACLERGLYYYRRSRMHGYVLSNVGFRARYITVDMQKMVCMRAIAKTCVILCDVRRAQRYKSGEARN